MKRKIIFVLVDLLIITLSFVIFAWIKPATISYYIPTYSSSFLLFAFIWLFISIVINKFEIDKARNLKDVIVPILISNMTILSVISTLVYSFGEFSYSRFVVFGTIALSTLLEGGLAHVYYSFISSVQIDETKSFASAPATPEIIPTKIEDDAGTDFSKNRVHFKKIITEESSENAYNFISGYVDVGNPKNLMLSTTTLFNVEKLPPEKFLSIVNLKRINDIRRINKFFEAVNSKLPFGGIFINCAETYRLRAKRIKSSYPPVLNYIIYFFDYIFKRVFPKLFLTKKIYFFITRGKNRVISRAETLGRLYSCGFEVIEEQFVDGLLYFAVKKVKEPVFDFNPTYGPLVRLRRVGKNGKLIGVYKMRTMHAYSEYLQPYIYEKFQLQDGGKFNNDFRVTTIGKIMRKFWIDEFPMFINVVKGEMKIVGVRPLSRHYFELYSDDLKEKRKKHKPGLIPPFYVDMPKTLEEIMESEMKYLNAYEKNPFFTDMKYFLLAFYNIIFRNARSK